MRRVVLGSTHIACHQMHALSMSVLRAGVFGPHSVGPVLPRDLSQLLRLCATSRYLCILGLHSVVQGSWKELLQAASSLLPWLPCAQVPHAGCTAALCNSGRTGQSSLLFLQPMELSVLGKYNLEAHSSAWSQLWEPDGVFGVLGGLWQALNSPYGWDLGPVP